MATPQVLAATLTIAFQGLMMFQGSPKGGEHVAIIDALDHYHKDPSIEICHKGATGAYDLTKCTKVGLLKDDVVSFNVATGVVSTGRLYRRHVPKLKSFIKSGAIHQNVVNQTTPAPGVLSFVFLPPGRLTTWRTFDEPVEFLMPSGKKPTSCFAKFVVLETTISGPVKMFVRHQTPAGSTTDQYSIASADLIFVSNISADAQHQHFPLYASLLTTGGQLVNINILHGTTCSTINDGVGMLSKEVEDALKGFKTPNGDCGPVDNPRPGG